MSQMVPTNKSMQMKIKKRQKEQQESQEKRQEEEEEDQEDLDEQSQSKPKKEINQDGEQYWPLTKNKRLSVGVFKGNVNINLREYFQKDGKWLPTKKGITLNPQSWKVLKSLVKDIDELIQQKQKKK